MGEFMSMKCEEREELRVIPRVLPTVKMVA
jgi:hypothetical protein